MHCFAVMPVAYSGPLLCVSASFRFPLSFPTGLVCTNTSCSLSLGSILISECIEFSLEIIVYQIAVGYASADL